MMFACQCLYECVRFEWVFVRASEDSARPCLCVNVCMDVYCVSGCSCVRLRTARDRVCVSMSVMMCTV